MLLNALQESGYSFLEGAAKYSAGVGTSREFSITRIQFTAPLPLRPGFQVAALPSKGWTSAYPSLSLRVQITGAGHKSNVRGIQRTLQV
jgi:hypothetical protein